MTGVKLVLALVVFAVVVSCDQNAKEVDGQQKVVSRVVRQSEDEAEKQVALQEQQIMPVKEQVLIRRLKGQEEIELADEGNDSIGKINRFKRSPKSLKKGGGGGGGGGVAKGGGGCKKGRK